MDNQQANK
jgi:actin-related protein